MFGSGNNGKSSKAIGGWDWKGEYVVDVVWEKAWVKENCCIGLYQCGEAVTTSRGAVTVTGEFKRVQRILDSFWQLGNLVSDRTNLIRCVILPVI